MKETKYKGKEIVDSQGNKGIIIGVTEENKYTVRFEDGIEADYHLSHLKSHEFIHPNYKRYRTEAGKEKYLGKIFKTNEGYNIKIVDYKNAKDVTIEYEDGTQKNAQLSNILIGNIRRRMETEKYLGKIFKTNEGYNVKIVDYKNAKNVTIEYEDGTQKNAQLNSILIGNVRKRVEKEKYLGKTFKTNEGYTVKVIGYKNARDVTIEYEDGTRKNVQLGNILRGLVSKNGKNTYMYTGKKVTDSKGNKGEIVGETKENIYTVRFDDGIVGEYYLGHLKNGKFTHPNYERYRVAKAKERYLGKTFKTNEGYNVKVIKYNNSSDITIEYEDGTRQKVYSSALSSGSIRKRSNR